MLRINLKSLQSSRFKLVYRIFFAIAFILVNILFLVLFYWAFRESAYIEDINRLFLYGVIIASTFYLFGFLVKRFKHSIFILILNIIFIVLVTSLRVKIAAVEYLAIGGFYIQLFEVFILMIFINLTSIVLFRIKQQNYIIRLIKLILNLFTVFYVAKVIFDISSTEGAFVANSNLSLAYISGSYDNALPAFIILILVLALITISLLRILYIKNKRTKAFFIFISLFLTFSLITNFLMNAGLISNVYTWLPLISVGYSSNMLIFYLWGLLAGLEYE